MITKVTSDYVINLIKNGKRFDARKMDEMRDLKIEYGISKNAEGSAKVTLGKTIVMAGVKLGLSTPYPDSPDEGVLTTSAEFLTIAAPEFEAGLPSEEAVELARVVDRGVREGHAIDLKKLCIKEKEKVWMVFLDILIINHDGNLIDAAGIAALAALSVAKMPNLVVEGDEYTIDREDMVEPLPLNDLPIPVTIRKNGNAHIVDTTAIEENAISGRLTVTTKANGNICAMQQGGTNAFTVEEINSIVAMSQKIGKEIREKHFK
ncbi:Exosome complex component Rrp42 [uncultured archaeon]|nr:Exosome complex component Rrp42 [uncultured archaeon]